MKRFYYLMPVLAIAVGVFLSILVFTGQVAKDQRAQFIGGGGFTLSHGERKISLSDYEGSPIILYFGFTHCPDVCPTGLAKIRDMFESVPELQRGKALFVTLDPERDTPDVIETYTQFFHANIIGLSGTLEETAAVAKQYATYFKKVDVAGESDSYTIDHTSYFYLIDGQGELMRVLDTQVSAEKIAEEFSKLI